MDCKTAEHIQTFCRKPVKSKPHEALQSLVTTTRDQPGVGCAGCALHEKATWCLPIAWCSTGRMFMPDHSKGFTSILLCPG